VSRSLGQVIHFAMQRQQLARKSELAVSQFGFALQYQEATVLGGFDDFGLGFFRAIAFETGTAINQPGGKRVAHHS